MQPISVDWERSSDGTPYLLLNLGRQQIIATVEEAQALVAGIQAAFADMDALTGGAITGEAGEESHAP